MNHELSLLIYIRVRKKILSQSSNINVTLKSLLDVIDSVHEGHAPLIVYSFNNVQIVAMFSLKHLRDLNKRFQDD